MSGNRNFYADGRTYACVKCGTEKPMRFNGKNLYCSRACLPITQKGRVFSKETKAKMSVSSKGLHKSPATEIKKGQRIGRATEFIKGNMPWHKGKTGVYTEDQLARITEGNRNHNYKGERHWNWQGGITDEMMLLRAKFKKTVQPKVLARDNYTCQICDQYGGTMHVDHIQSWKEFPELRFEMSNCRTLCVPCHYYVTFKKKMPNTSCWGFRKTQG